ncbi:hypothetical protein BD413DRAFT_6916 [Trametes elegans]|nr:hypothetical protein BD413DRAFT_6916 [Trametes elegans]
MADFRHKRTSTSMSVLAHYGLRFFSQVPSLPFSLPGPTFTYSVCESLVVPNPHAHSDACLAARNRCPRALLDTLGNFCHSTDISHSKEQLPCLGLVRTSLHRRGRVHACQQFPVYCNSACQWGPIPGSRRYWHQHQYSPCPLSDGLGFNDLLVLADVTIGEYTVKNQAIALLHGAAKGTGVNGFIGLAAASVPFIYHKLENSTWADNGILLFYNVFSYQPDLANYIAFLLTRDQAGITSGGVFTISECRTTVE